MHHVAIIVKDLQKSLDFYCGVLGKVFLWADTCAVQACFSMSINYYRPHRLQLMAASALGLNINEQRPHDKLPYAGAWLWIGPEMIHLMELPNPDPMDGRPAHGGRDRHFCVGVESVDAIADKLEAAGVELTRSKSGRPAIFFRDPDMNTIECVEGEHWREGL